MPSCKGICARHKVSGGHGQKYATGKKRCSQCEIWTYWPGRNCPCCRQQLRTMPSSAKDKAAYKETMRIIAS